MSGDLFLFEALSPMRSDRNLPARVLRQADKPNEHLLLRELGLEK